MLNHNWPVILDASRVLLAEARELGHLLTGLPGTPSRTELWIAESVQRRLRGPASAAIFRFTRDIRTGNCNVPVDHNAEMLWTIYAGREDVRLAVLRLWRFYADLIQPKLFGPQTTYTVERDAESVTLKPNYPPVRSDEEWHADAVDLVKYLLEQSAEFEAAVASLQAAVEDSDRLPSERDAWFYEQGVEGRPWKEIHSELKRIYESRGWELVEGSDAVRMAANRYQERNQLPLIPKRRSGRRKTEQ